MAVAGVSLSLKNNDLDDMSSFFLDVLKQLQFIDLTAIALLLLGLAGSAASIALGFAGLINSKSFTVIALSILFVIALGMIAGGALILDSMGDLNKAIYSGASNSSAGALVAGTLTSNFIHFSYTIFNGCCAVNAWSQEYGQAGFVPLCSDLTIVQRCRMAAYLSSSEKAYCLSPGVNEPPTDLAQGRSCYYDPYEYRKFNVTFAANQYRLCDTFKRTKVDITGVKIPGSRFDASTLTAGRTVLPIVGLHTNPTYGCGAGFAKGLMGTFYVYALASLQSPYRTLLICGSLIVCFIILAAVTTFGGCVSGRNETSEEKYARYMEEVQQRSAVMQASQGAGGGAGYSAGSHNAGPYHPAAYNVSQVGDAFEQHNPNARMSVQSNGTQKYSQYGREGGSVPNAEVVVSNFNVDDKI